MTTPPDITNNAPDSPLGKSVVRTLVHRGQVWVNRNDLIEWLDKEDAAVTMTETKRWLALFREQIAKLL